MNVLERHEHIKNEGYNENHFATLPIEDMIHYNSLYDRLNYTGCSLWPIYHIWKHAFCTNIHGILNNDDTIPCRTLLDISPYSAVH